MTNIRISVTNRMAIHGLAIPKDSGRDKGKGQGGKQSTNGKGQQMISCWTCGGNHRQQHCWKNHHVRQVADAGSKCTHGNSDEFEFDLGALGDFGKLSIRAVHSKQSLCDVSCGQFFVGSDDD